MARGRRKVGAMNFGYGSFADETLQTTVQGFQDQVYSQVNFSRSQELEKRSGREWHTWWIWQTALSGAVGMLRFPHAPYSDYFLDNFFCCSCCC